MQSPLRDKINPISISRCRPETVARWEKMRQVGMPRFIMLWTAVYSSLVLVTIVGVYILDGDDLKIPLWVPALCWLAATLGGLLRAWSQWTCEEKQCSELIGQIENQ